MKPASWVIKRHADGEVICEIFDGRKLPYLKPEFEAVPILEYLVSLNKGNK